MEFLQTHDNLNIHSSCRTCLQNLTESNHDIFQTPDLPQKYTKCTSLNVEPDDGFPTSLCEPCLTKIEDFYDFQQMCLSAIERFQSFLKTERKPSTLELEIETNLPSETFVLKEAKKEKEDDPISWDEHVVLEIPNMKILEESSTEHDDSDDDDQGLKFEQIEEHNKSSYDKTSENEDSDSYIKPKVKRKSHPTIVNLECEICKKCFKKPEILEAHMRVHQGLKPFPCTQCDKSYARRSRLKLHIKSNHEGLKPEPRFACTEQECDKKYASKQTLRKHIKDVHSGNDSKSRQPYICEECGKILTSLATLKNHRYLHTGQQGPFQCPQPGCQKRYITKNKLKEHLNRHLGIRNYICPHCGAKKSTRTELNTHINYHTKEKTYPCPFCDMVFNSIGNFSRHKRIVHEGVKDYPCSYCDKSFGKAETRKHHEMTHTGEKPHECNVCHKKFIQIVALKKHKKIHMKNMGPQPPSTWQRLGYQRPISKPDDS